MGTAAPTPMLTDTQILTLSQWLSPAYPVGSFAYSHGLEAAVASGWLRDGNCLGAWLEDVLSRGAGFSDALFLAAAYRAGNTEKLAEIDATIRAFAASKERLFEATQQGSAFCAVTAAVWGDALAGLSYPVAMGRAAYLQDLPLHLTIKMYLLAFISNLVAASQRLMAIGQTEGQKIVRKLAPACVQVAARAETGNLSLLSSTSFMIDIASMQHETQHSRIFRT